MELKSNEEKITRALLVSVDTGEYDAQASLDELFELVKSAGADPVLSVTQNLQKIEKGTFVGTGKLADIAEICESQEIDLLVFDSELSPTQIKNIEAETDVRVIDRTTLILDIFAQRARSKEGKLQVELAQLRYRASRLVGLGASLSRLGGGIGTRGPGEKKLESDRRLIRKRITALKEELSQVEKHRELLRTGRTRGKMKTAAIVGYTNAGKSTLLNTLTGAGVLSEDKLFATLDPTTRALTLDDGQQILLTDTVGFIRKLPHNLVEAFKSTLEEARYADYIIHVVDCSNPQAVQQMEVVYDTLQELEVQGKKTITLFNKVDMGAAIRMRDSNADHTLKVSAKTGEGLEDLKALLGKILSEEQIYVEKIFSYQEAGKIQLIREYGQLLSEEYTDTGILVKARVPQEIHGKLM